MKMRRCACITVLGGLLALSCPAQGPDRIEASPGPTGRANRPRFQAERGEGPGGPMTERWLAALSPREPFFHADRLPADGDGTGLTEAARGALGHWVSVRHGRIARYQIVAPTSWNFSPRDATGTPGALEAALEGAPVREGEDTPVAVQHIVRSFDPCMVCTVH